MDPALQARLRSRFATMLMDSKLSIPRRQYKQKAQALYSSFKASLQGRKDRKSYQQLQAEERDAQEAADVMKDDPMSQEQREQYHIKAAAAADVEAVVVTQDPQQALHDLSSLLAFSKDVLSGGLLSRALDPLYTVSKEHGVCADHILQELCTLLGTATATTAALQVSVRVLQKERDQYKGETQALAKMVSRLATGEEREEPEGGGAAAAAAAGPVATVAGGAARRSVNEKNKKKSMRKTTAGKAEAAPAVLPAVQVGEEEEKEEAPATEAAGAGGAHAAGSGVETAPDAVQVLVPVLEQEGDEMEVEKGVKQVEEVEEEGEGEEEEGEEEEGEGEEGGGEGGGGEEGGGGGGGEEEGEGGEGGGGEGGEEEGEEEGEGTVHPITAAPTPPPHGGSLQRLGNQHRARQVRSHAGGGLGAQSALQKAKEMMQKADALSETLHKSERQMHARSEEREREQAAADKATAEQELKLTREAFVRRGHRQALVRGGPKGKKAGRGSATTGALDKYSADADPAAALKLEQISRAAAFRVEKLTAAAAEAREAEQAVTLLEEQIRRMTAQLERTKESLLTPKQRKRRDEEEAAKLAEIRARVELRQKEHLAKPKLARFLLRFARNYKGRRKRRETMAVRLQRWTRTCLFWKRIRFRLQTTNASYFLACVCYRRCVQPRRRRRAAVKVLQRWTRACIYSARTRLLARNVVRAVHAKAAAFCQDKLAVYAARMDRLEQFLLAATPQLLSREWKARLQAEGAADAAAYESAAGAPLSTLRMNLVQFGSYETLHKLLAPSPTEVQSAVQLGARDMHVWAALAQVWEQGRNMGSQLSLLEDVSQVGTRAHVM